MLSLFDAERFFSKVRLPLDRQDCWIWIAARSKEGYGRIQWNGQVVGAHRVAYTMVRGEIPKGLVLDHLCRTRACVNPDHLDPCTNQENVRRATRKGPRPVRPGLWVNMLFDVPDYLKAVGETVTAFAKRAGLCLSEVLGDDGYQKIVLASRREPTQKGFTIIREVFPKSGTVTLADLAREK